MTMRDKLSNYNEELHKLQIKKAKIELETAIILKEVAENKRLSSISELRQNEYKENILKL